MMTVVGVCKSKQKKMQTIWRKRGTRKIERGETNEGCHA